MKQSYLILKLPPYSSLDSILRLLRLLLHRPCIYFYDIGIFLLYEFLLSLLDGMLVGIDKPCLLL